MKLSDEECFALLFTLGEGYENLEPLLDDALVSERVKTGVGFFATIILNGPFFSGNDKCKYWEKNFEHNNMLCGGCFMIWQVEPTKLEVEAVAFEGGWPELFIESEFN